jgi:hypothetical protein
VSFASDLCFESSRLPGMTAGYDSPAEGRHAELSDDVRRWEWEGGALAATPAAEDDRALEAARGQGRR